MQTGGSGTSTVSSLPSHGAACTVKPPEDFLKSILLGSAHSPERCPPRGWPDGCEAGWHGCRELPLLSLKRSRRGVHPLLSMRNMVFSGEC